MWPLLRVSLSVGLVSRQVCCVDFGFRAKCVVYIFSFAVMILSFGCVDL